MSGGAFDYKQYYITDIAEDIKRMIVNEASTGLNEYGDKISNGYTKETINEFKTAVYLLEMAAIYAQRVDWLVSDDDGEDCFHRRLKDEIEPILKTVVQDNQEHIDAVIDFAVNEALAKAKDNP
jgi:hypothetical protein